MSDNLDNERLVDERQAAAFLGLSPATLSTWRSTKRSDLPFHRLGSRAIRYKLADIRAWRDRQRIGGAE